MWEDLYAELKNKLRWSISTACAAQFSMSYRASEAVAKPLAQLVIEGLKLKNEKPDLDLAEWMSREMSGKDLDKS